MNHPQVSPTGQPLREGAYGAHGYSDRTIVIEYPHKRGWGEAVTAGAPHTPVGVVLNMRIQSPFAVASGSISVHLVNFKRSIQNDQYALGWASEHKKMPAGPWLLMALGEQQPELPRHLRESFIYISSLVHCDFYKEKRTVYLAYLNGRRQLLMAYPDRQCNANTWFAFLSR